MKLTERLEKSKLFVPYVDPVSGKTSYVFRHPDIPHAQSFYFTNRSISRDGRYIWAYIAFPPSCSAAYGRTLGVVDTVLDTFTHFPTTAFFDASPLVDEESGDVYFGSLLGICRKSPDPSEPPVLVAPLPDFLRGKGVLQNVATHMTFSSDRTRVCFDAHIGDRFVFGDVELASGRWRRWCEFDYCKNHAQMSPTDPDLMMIAEDDYSLVESGERRTIRYDENGKLARIYLLRRGDAEPTYIPPLFVEARHEWWSSDGKSIYYVDWDNGTIRYSLTDGSYEIVDPRGTWHAHTSKDGTLFVADENEIDGKKWYRGCPSRVHLYDRKADRYVNIVTENPALYKREEPCRYHIDPHPQFALDDQVVMFTTTVTGKVSFAISELAHLLEE